MATFSTTEDPFETNDEICQKLIDEFVLKTNTDEALAQFYLQDRNWNLSLSLNDYFEHISNEPPSAKESKPNKQSPDRPDVIDLSSDDDQDQCFSGDTKKCKKHLLDGGSSAPSDDVFVTDVKEFRFITWNIDGIDEKNLRLRTEAVCHHILDEKALIVFLQEVIPLSERIIRENLTEYQIFTGMNRSVGYYTITAIHKTYVKLESNEVIDYPNSIMGRNLLKTKVRIGSASIILLNTHLESTKDFWKERVLQLNKIFDCISATPSTESVIFAGDLNLRDREVSETKGIPRGVYDVWIKTGSRRELEYTWDMSRNDNLEFQGRFKPRCRFDRIFVRPAVTHKIDAIHFGLIGLERLKPHVCFPSDHWGLRVHFDIN